MTRETLEALRGLEAKATNANWACGKGDCDGAAQVYATHDGPMRRCVPVANTMKVDGDFIVSARNNLPQLIRIAEAAMELLEQGEIQAMKKYTPVIDKLAAAIGGDDAR